MTRCRSSIASSAGAAAVVLTLALTATARATAAAESATLTTTSTTSSSTALDPHECLVTFRLQSPATAEEIYIHAGYRNVFGGFVGGNGECVQTHAAPVTFAYDREDHLEFTVVAYGRFRGPAGLAHCRFLAYGDDPEPAAFHLEGEIYAEEERPAKVAIIVQCPSSSATTTTFPDEAAPCGAPLTLGAKPTATDALYILRAAVGTEACDPCVCSVSGNDTITVRDALTVLRATDSASFDCPACPAIDEPFPHAAQSSDTLSSGGTVELDGQQ